jgi:hypothetical protein
MSELSNLIVSAVEELLVTAPDMPPDQMPAAVNAALWPHVQKEVQSILSARDVVSAPAPATDRRARPWQYVVRFWKDSDLIAETDPLVTMGTGGFPKIVEGFLYELHAEEGRPTLTADEVKLRLPQLRNNLGRASSSSMQFPYSVGEIQSQYMCQVDVYRLEG